MNDFFKANGIILMGVSSTGKSSVGAALAKVIGAKFIDGDDLHPRNNILKMSNKQPLNDDDRSPWLERIRDAAFSLEKKNETGIIVCSALKKKYRDLIREGNEHVAFLHLAGDFELVLARMQARKGHFMPVELLKNQFETLESPDASEPDVIHIDIDGNFDEVVDRCVTAIHQRGE
ncbi:carbohydrate kinase, thermoresistant glucokinase family [Tolumonas auensis DSM 9187]|uniref:Gluconokinase n=1 Tax=Tolumonas auensis (strain DSM 9187 / NBRC 110442 / TA 4) TaxID=595494 RepID=C4L8I7_TOLAT|nr:gluconokinase [Tolumonas auensis]ACQ91857.1 carbohydrate kinase, thermoresistant glucokinase family [Tolumonas auensis DSM 9187]